MSLSDQERTEGLIFQVHHLVEHVVVYEEWDKVWGSEKNLRAEFFKTVKSLPHLLLQGNRNGAYWILGGDLSKKVSWSEPNLYSVVIRDHCEKKCEMPYTKEFDARDQLQIESLLYEVRYVGPWLRLLYETYERIESCQYNLKRYKDEFSESLDELDTALDYLKGLCHIFFRKNQNSMTKSYVIHEMVNYIYGGQCPLGGAYPYKEEKEKWGRYTEVLHESMLYHKMRAWMNSREDFQPIKDLHRQLIEAYHDKTLDTLKGQQLRFIAAVSLCKLDEYGGKQLRLKLKKKGVVVTKDIDKAIKSSFAWLKKCLKEDEEDRSKNSRWEELSLYDL